MSPDTSLNSSFPSVNIDGEQFHYGWCVLYSVWLVEHHADAKRVWRFLSRDALIDFLDNLPESASHPTYQGAPLWLSHGLIPEEDYRRRQREHREGLRLLLEEKRKREATFRY